MRNNENGPRLGKTREPVRPARVREITLGEENGLSGARIMVSPLGVWSGRGIECVVSSGRGVHGTWVVWVYAAYGRRDFGRTRVSRSSRISCGTECVEWCRVVSSGVEYIKVSKAWTAPRTRNLTDPSSAIRF
jgi:hypothetical protein